MHLTPQGHLIRTNSNGYFENPFTYDEIHEESKRILNIEPSWTKEDFVSFLENFGTTLIELINKRYS